MSQTPARRSTLCALLIGVAAACPLVGAQTPQQQPQQLQAEVLLPEVEPELRDEGAPPLPDDAAADNHEPQVLDGGPPPLPTGEAPHADAVVVFDAQQQARHLMPTEPAPLLYALDLVQASWLRGPHYRVENKVLLSGGFPTFFVRSDYGPLEARGVEMLAIRVEEFQALAELERISNLDVFGKSASRAVKRTAVALKNVFSSPAETIRGLPSAIGRKLRNTFASAKEGAKNLADQAREGMRNEDGDLIAANPFLPPPPPEVQLSEAEQDAVRNARAKNVGRQAGQSYIGYNKSRRDLARMLGIDPYSRNPLIMDRLDSLAWSSLAGSAGTGMTIGALTGGASAVLSKSRQLNSLVWEIPEEDLKKRNRDELKKAGFIDSASRALIRNGAFTTSLQTAYVDLVVQFRTTRGAQRLLELGAEARDELDARYLIHALDLALEHETEQQQRFARIRAISNQPVFEMGRSGLVVPAPADYLYLSDEMRDFLDLEEFRNTENVLLGHARLTTRLREELQSRGWKVQHTKVNPALPYVQPEY